MAVESPPTALDQRPPRVFLSYSHDSPEHAARVLSLAQQLRRDGVDAGIDQFDAHPAEGWPLWCARQILDSEYVLLICTETYRQRFLGYEQPGKGRGVKWEGKILQNILYRDERNTQFVPVVFTREDERFIPETVAETTWTLLGDFGAADPGYAALVQRFSGGRFLAPLPDLVRVPEPDRPPDASVATGEVADAVAIQLGKIDDILAQQQEHERKSRKRHRVLVAGMAVLLLAGIAGWIALARSHEKGVAKIEQAVLNVAEIVVDPVVLRAKLEEKIDQTFDRKKGELLAAKAPSADVDALYHWRDGAKEHLAAAVAFITARAGDVDSPIIREAAVALKERGVDAALEFLDAKLKEQRQRREEEGRQLAEASLMKAGLHELRLETNEEERAVRDAVADAPDWWRPHFELGSILYRRAEWKPAELEYEAARKSMPADAEAVVLNNLALLYQATNRLAEAELLIQRALKIDEKSFGPEHPVVAIRLSNLAGLYRDTNRLSEAEPLLKRALKIDEKSLGPEHPDVAIRLSNLASLYQDTNRLAEAEPLLKRVTSMFEESYGPEHPNVATSLNNLAQLYKATNRLAEAEPLMRRHLVIFMKFTRKTGHPHPHLSAAIVNYTDLLGMMSLPKADVTQRLAEAVREASYTPEEFSTLLRQLGE